MAGFFVIRKACLPYRVQLDRLRWMVSSSSIPRRTHTQIVCGHSSSDLIRIQVPSPVSCFENSQGVGPRTCLRRRRKASSTRSIRRHFGGLVRSPISATLPQIGSRLYVAWGILWSFPETRTHILVSSLVISWAITEIIRYSFFGTKEAVGSAPSFLMWLRYSTFLLLYPTGITSEVGLIYIALPYMKASEKYCVRMPNKWNFSFDYFYAAILVLGIYVPGSPHMFTYMLGQRKKALSKSKRE